MPPYKEGDEKNYFPTMIAALIVIALAIAAFVFGLVGQSELDDIIIDESDGFVRVSPGPGLAQPTSPPEDIAAPLSPPEF